MYNVSCRVNRCFTNPFRFMAARSNRIWSLHLDPGRFCSPCLVAHFESQGKKAGVTSSPSSSGEDSCPPPSAAAIPKCTSVPGPYPWSTSVWCWILWFSSSLWYDLTQKPEACRKGLGGIQRGLLDGTYGNYSLIYHLGHGNSCKLGFH